MGDRYVLRTSVAGELQPEMVIPKQYYDWGFGTCRKQRAES